jgi:hypothetical protein
MILAPSIALHIEWLSHILASLPIDKAALIHVDSGN